MFFYQVYNVHYVNTDLNMGTGQFPLDNYPPDNYLPTNKPRDNYYYYY